MRLSSVCVGLLLGLGFVLWVSPTSAEDGVVRGRPSLKAPSRQEPEPPARDRKIQAPVEIDPGKRVPVVPGRTGTLGAKPGGGGDPFPKKLQTRGGAGHGRPGELLGRGFQGNLQNCQPASNCFGGSKPCYVEIPQDGDATIALVGNEGGGSPVQQKAAYRIRLCTDANDGVCQDTSSDQRLNYYFFHYADPSDTNVLALQVSTSGSTDTGAYSEVGTHDFFGVSCLNGDQPCRFAWQYCELPPNDPGSTK